MNYNIYKLIDIIESDDRIKFLRQQSNSGLTARVYSSDYDTTVIIDMTDEDPTDGTIIGWLTELGLDDMIPAMFPSQKTAEK